ncbi:MAG: YceI family protein [Candidatus Omnitrophica bacterium]|nr:YceI family protein [Candidatus Omnitrophota bacterium]
MKKIILMTAFMLIGAVSPVFSETYRVSPESAKVRWDASKVTGKHWGHIPLVSGTIVFEGGQFVGGETVLDARSIAVDDIQDPESNAKLTRHLKSADFFDAEGFPEASLKITGVESRGEDNYLVTGDLTIKGVTQSVSFPAAVKMTAQGVQASAQITVDRTQYGIRYGSGKFFENLGDRLIHDEFQLTVEVSAEASR